MLAERLGLAEVLSDHNKQRMIFIEKPDIVVQRPVEQKLVFFIGCSGAHYAVP